MKNIVRALKIKLPAGQSAFLWGAAQDRQDYAFEAVFS